MSIDITNKKIYLSGPMTGIEDHNRAAFDGAELDLLGAGADEVYDPAEYIDEYASLSHEVCMALGNSWAPCARWIGERIAQLDIG